VSRIARYQFRPHELDRRITPPPGTDDLDEALIATATMPVDVWDTQSEQWVPPIQTEWDYRQLLYRVNRKRRQLKPRWDRIICAIVLFGTLGYCTYVLVN
jgi:hypothetical protein